MESRIEKFLRERQYLTNVSPATVECYRRRLRWLPSENPSLAELKEMVMMLRNRGLKEAGVNAIIRCVNTYLHWEGGRDSRCGPGCNHLRLSQLKEPKLVLPTFTPEQIRKLVSWKPKGHYEMRLHLLILTLLDTGCRISEALTLRLSDIDYANLLLTVNGKGRKQRLIPFSIELRKEICRYCKQASLSSDSLLFGCRTKGVWSRRNALRDLKRLCKELGFPPPARTLHACRHSFATNYIRRGGSEFHLQRVLGHSTLEMTRRYVNLVTTDLQAVHERVSLLSNK